MVLGDCFDKPCVGFAASCWESSQLWRQPQRGSRSERSPEDEDHDNLGNVAHHGDDDSGDIDDIDDDDDYVKPLLQMTCGVFRWGPTSRFGISQTCRCQNPPQPGHLFWHLGICIWVFPKKYFSETSWKDKPLSGHCLRPSWAPQSHAPSLCCTWWNNPVEQFK